jgi:membrane protease YdiL (CAAX protease family)
MSARSIVSLAPGAHTITVPARDRVWLLVPASLGLLLIRPLFAPGPAGAWLLTASYLAIGVASVLAARTVPPASAVGPRNHTPFPALGGLALGFGAFALAAAGQRTVHMPFGPVGLGLTMMASIAEEAFFRGFLYGRLVRHGALLAVVATAGAFALIHVSAYPPAAVWVDLGAGLIFGWQRWATGSWLVPAGTHVFANLLVVMA